MRRNERQTIALMQEYKEMFDSKRTGYLIPAEMADMLQRFITMTEKVIQERDDLVEMIGRT